jgi:class 3 adenylate cyclase
MRSIYKSFFILVFFLLTATYLSAQSAESIVIQMSGTSGKEFVDLANQASEAYFKKRKYDDAAEYAEDAWRIAKNIGDKEGQALSYLNWGKGLVRKPASGNVKRANKRRAAGYFEEAANLTSIESRELEALKLYRIHGFRSLSASERSELNARIINLDDKLNPEEIPSETPSSEVAENSSPIKPKYAIDEIEAFQKIGKKLKQKENRIRAEHQAELAELEGLYEDEINKQRAAIDTMSAEQAKRVALLAQQELINLKLENKIEKDSLELMAINSELKEVEATNMYQKAENERIRLLFLLVGAVAIGLLLVLLVSISLSRKVRKEKKKSDALLGNILPKHIIEALKGKSVNKGGEIIAKKHNNVSVMFLDFKGFSSFAKAKKNNPKEVVQLLNTYFKRFDDIIVNKYNLEKIKTIGDAYMCAAGVQPSVGDRYQYKRQQAEKLVQAALEINRFVKNEAIIAQRNGRPYFDCRIGIHTGDVIAGVVGEKKYAYDIWGDTVNTASRVESNGQINTVNVSENTKEMLDHKFNFGEARIVQAKNIGGLNIYDVRM